MTEPQTPSTTPDALRSRVIEALKTCFDPEIPVDIYELGLIYDVKADDDGAVEIKMTLTINASPSRDAAGSAPAAARIPAAIGRSRPAPLLRRSAGARFTVTRRSGKRWPILAIAARTRAALSRTSASGCLLGHIPQRPHVVCLDLIGLGLFDLRRLFG